jgi:hypothetical protein
MSETKKNDALLFDPYFNPINATPQVQIQSEVDILPAKTSLLIFSIGGTEFKKTVRDDSIIQSEGVDKTLLSTQTRLIDKLYVEEITKLDGHTKRRLEALGIPSEFASNGQILVPNGLVGHASRIIERYKIERTALVEKLIYRWDDAVNEIRLRNPTIFKEEDYPTRDQIRGKFYVKFRILNVKTPDNLREFDEKLHAKLVEEDRKAIAEDLGHIKQALRAGFAELILNMESKVKRIGVERTTFKEGFCESMRDFLSTFEAKNIAGDSEMSELVKKAKDILAGVTPDKLRENMETKVLVENGLKEIAANLKDWTQVKGRPVKL